jgi:hypothetical protein
MLGAMRTLLLFAALLFAACDGGPLALDAGVRVDAGERTLLEDCAYSGCTLAQVAACSDAHDAEACLCVETWCTRSPTGVECNEPELRACHARCAECQCYAACSE